MTDGQHNGSVFNNRIAITKFAGVFDFGGDLRQFLKQKFSHQARMPCRTAAGNDKAACPDDITAVLNEFLQAIMKLPDQMRHVLEQSEAVRQAACQYIHRENWLFLGRGFNYPVALEGALKLKEISYIHAEGLPAAEMKHGPIALINPGMPAVFVATRGSQYEKLLGNIQEVKARGGKIIAVASEGDDHIHGVADHVFTVPETIEPLQPLLTVLPLQLLAYHAAVARGCNVDKPRNLAKSVTVE